MGMGFRLKEILREKGISIKELSALSGISLNTLYSITKRDSDRIDPVLQRKIAEVLNISIQDLQEKKISNEGDFNRYLSGLGYNIYFDDPEHPPFLITNEGVYALEYDDLKYFRESANDYLKFIISETLKKREKIR